jgi:hypothetical protein
MKKVISAILVVILMTSGILFGCRGIIVDGSGNLKTETYELGDFTEIKAANGFQVEITKSNTFSVKVIVDDNVLEHIEITKSGNELRLRTKGNRLFRSVTLKAKITMPDLHNIELSGGSKADVTGFSSSNDLSAELSGGSHITGDIKTGNANLSLSGGSHVYISGSVNNLDVKCSGGSHITLSGSINDVDVECSGGSHVTLSGSAGDLNLKGSGGSHFRLEDLPADNATINLSGGSHATINVTGTLNAKLSNASEVIYIGQPTMGDIDLSWDSEISNK